MLYIVFICENKDADQLRSNCEADQHLCFCHTDSTIPLLLISKVSSFYLYSVTVQPGLCRTWSETQIVMHRLIYLSETWNNEIWTKVVSLTFKICKNTINNKELGIFVFESNI